MLLKLLQPPVYSRELDNQYVYSEMALELWLDIIAFYRRCAHSSFTTSSVDTWSLFAIAEYDYAVNNLRVVPHEVSNFDGALESFSKKGFQWCRL
jgi:hypothetical protein